MHGGQIRNRRLYCQRPRPVPKAVFRAGRGGQWAHYIVSDHLWFDLTKGFSGADLSPGDVVEFCARVSAYEKGYKGHKDDVLNRPIERDYRLSRPTKIKKIGKKLILKDEGK